MPTSPNTHILTVATKSSHKIFHEASIPAQQACLVQSAFQNRPSRNESETSFTPTTKLSAKIAL